MSTKSTIRIVLSLTCLAFVACDQASDSLVNIPNVAVGCTSNDDPECSTARSCSPLHAVVVMTRSGCSTPDFESIATSSVEMVCDANGCDGTVSTWTDPATGGTVDQVLTGRMDICSYVDIDCNAAEDGADLSHSSTAIIQSSSTISIDSWN